MFYFSDYHQSGKNTALRVGNDPSGSRKAGVFHSTSVTETTQESLGEGTAYCGRVFSSAYKYTRPYYYISTGIANFEHLSGTQRVRSECFAESDDISESAHCNTFTDRGQCPLGWGNRASTKNFNPGCINGTYYPHATPASSTDPFTGSFIDRFIHVAGGDPKHNFLVGVSYGDDPNSKHPDLGGVYYSGCLNWAATYVHYGSLRLKLSSCWSIS